MVKLWNVDGSGTTVDERWKSVAISDSEAFYSNYIVSSAKIFVIFVRWSDLLSIILWFQSIRSLR